MKSTAAILSLGLLLGASAPALAAATPEEAQRLTGLFQSYLGSAPGVVSVTPQGDAYAAKLDLAPLFALVQQPGLTLSVSPLEWTLTDQGGGKWKVDQMQPLSFAFGIAGQSDTKGAIGSVTSTGIYDEALGGFATSSAEMHDITADQSVTDKGQTTRISYSLAALTMQSTMQGSAESGDVTSSYGFTGLKETISAPAAPDGSTPAMDITVTAPAGTQDGTVKGLKTKAIADLVKWLVAHKDPQAMVAEQQALKDQLRAALPLFTSMSGTSTIGSLGVGTMFGQFAIKQLGVGIEMNGIVADGRLRESFSVTGLELPAALLPPWAAGLVPQNFTIDVGAADFDLATPAGIILDKLDLSKPEPLPKDLDQQLLPALLPKGAATIALGPSEIIARLFQLSAEGSMTAGPVAMPSGEATVKLKGADETLAALQSGPPDLQQMAPMLLLMKGLAKPEGDGSLSWKIEATDTGTVTVNGNDMTKMMGGQQ